MNKDAEAKTKLDKLAKEIEKEKLALAEAQAQKRKAEESAIEVQAKL